MKTAIVSGAFYPHNSPRSFRTAELAKELARQGHQVTVYIPQNHYDYCDLKERYGIDIQFIDIKQQEGLDIKGNKISILIKRVLNRISGTYLGYPFIQYVWLLPRVFAESKGFDLLISIAVPHQIHWGVAKSFKKNAQLARIWIADCGDPFMLCKTDTFKKPFYFKAFEKSFCRRANFITVPIESAKTGYYPEFWHKIHVIPQGFDFTKIRKADQYIPNEVVTFIYAGGFIPGFRDPRPVLNFLIQQEIDFRFYVYTNQFHLLTDYLPVLKEKMVVNDYIDREELIYRMSSCDFVLNLENGTSVQMPSKLIDYALSGRPILSIVTQHVDTEKFLQFLQRDYTRQYMVNNLEDYNIKNVAMKFLELTNFY